MAVELQCKPKMAMHCRLDGKKKNLLKDILFYCVGGVVAVYYGRCIFLLCYLYYFIVLNAKIKLLMLGVL